MDTRRLWHRHQDSMGYRTRPGQRPPDGMPGALRLRRYRPAHRVWPPHPPAIAHAGVYRLYDGEYLKVGKKLDHASFDKPPARLSPLFDAIACGRMVRQYEPGAQLAKQGSGWPCRQD